MLCKRWCLEFPWVSLLSTIGQTFCFIDIQSEGSQMLFYVWFEFTSWLRGVGQGKGAWDRFPDHLGLGQLCLLSMRSMTTERLNLYSANDFVLARCGFVRFIALRCMLSLMFCLNLKKVPPPILTIKIPCKNDLIWDLRWLQITTHVIE